MKTSSATHATPRPNPAAPRRPRVSICLPTRDSRKFLVERLDSIRQQTLTDWEVVAVDSGSTDGTCEYLHELAAHDPRFRLHQAPRDGIYPNLNRCIERATGEFVYIATSDDTMAPDCLEKLARALGAHPDCDLAHCPLRVIGPDGAGLPDTQAWWSGQSFFAQSSGTLRDLPHVRRAPADGLFILGGETVYLSLTELLIRRSLFARVGLFESRWGSVGDINWQMRATLVASTVHVPDTWASWRMHPGQATARVGLRSAEFARKVDEMVEHAARASRPLMPPEWQPLVSDARLRAAAELRRFIAAHRDSSGPLARKILIIRELLGGSAPARAYVRARLARASGGLAVTVIREWLSREQVIEPIAATGVGTAGSNASRHEHASPPRFPFEPAPNGVQPHPCPE